MKRALAVAVVCFALGGVGLLGGCEEEMDSRCVALAELCDQCS